MVLLVAEFVRSKRNVLNLVFLKIDRHLHTEHRDVVFITLNKSQWASKLFHDHWAAW